ncbi:MAG: rhodanese-like domain-containing protein [Oscillospiraceae bacterium]|nr:rhodanese-like domain-containing protein [Oscillospiraceae bacterium]
MRKTLILMMAVWLLAACGRVETMAEYRKCTAEEAKERMDGEPFILLDVRTEVEYVERHIEGAVLIPDTEIAARAETELPDKDALIFIYCRSGRRSESAARAMIGMGYTNVFDIGGILDWPYETVGG